MHGFVLSKYDAVRIISLVSQHNERMQERLAGRGRGYQMLLFGALTAV
jgi:hypothetical protein